jgi:GR25 family glycosyltransferase involved in LPS biosynthesis
MLNCLLINLESAEARRIFSLKNLSELNVKVSLINAVPATPTNSTSFNLTDSAKACFESHRKSWQYIDSEHMSCALIVEDDFHPVRKFDLDLIVSSFQNVDWDVIQIGYLNIGINAKIEIILKNSQSRMFRILGKIVKRFSGDSKLLCRKRIKEALLAPKGFIFGDFQSGAHAYLLSHAGSRKLSELPTSIMPVDAMLHILAECNSISSFRSRKNYVSQFSFPSQISQRNH